MEEDSIVGVGRCARVCACGGSFCFGHVKCKTKAGAMLLKNCCFAFFVGQGTDYGQIMLTLRRIQVLSMGLLSSLCPTDNTLSTIL